jgi:hypothetical protein
MKLNGKCYREYPEFPILPFDPAAFGFADDCSDSDCHRKCPCFASGEFLLWWNWPQPEEREWNTPMTRFFITAGERDNLDAKVLFQAETYRDLVRHLLLVPYVKPRPILESPWDSSLAQEFFHALAIAGFLRVQTGTVLMDAINRPMLAQDDFEAVVRYFQTIEVHIGDQAFSMVNIALENLDHLQQ